MSGNVEPQDHCGRLNGNSDELGAGSAYQSAQRNINNRTIAIDTGWASALS